MNRMASLAGIVYVQLACLLIASCTTTGLSYRKLAEGESFPPDPSISGDYQRDKDVELRLLTLNLAHGRNQSASQVFLDSGEIEQNLIAIAQVLRKSGADVVALQEADGPSRWSGNFDHVAFLARKAGYPWYFRANHAESWLFSYGTAILSRLPIVEIIQHTFEPSPPTLNKGFLLGQVLWDDSESAQGRTIDIVSVHLDFSRKSVRDRQIAEMREVLAGRNRPMIILGDFNSDWFAEDSVVRRLATEAGLTVYHNQAEDLLTYNGKQRLDWILISEELVFTRYQNLADIISDHLAVTADVRFRTATDRRAD